MENCVWEVVELEKVVVQVEELDPPQLQTSCSCQFAQVAVQVVPHPDPRRVDQERIERQQL